ncbi:MAG: hypothetical protein DRP29_00560 [Thermodesulfobacteriota bacterium]|nr:MAG: hypothetical protein DRP29_00560 [Thermodesulfobacteriota bacterium]
MEQEKLVNLAGLKVKVKKGVILPRHRKRPSCLTLTTADRLVMLLGKPAKELYTQIVKIYQWWSSSPEWMFEYTYHEGYVWKAQTMWYDLSGRIPGPGRVPPPVKYQKTINPDAYIADKQRELWRIILRLEYLQSRYRGVEQLDSPDWRAREDAKWLLRHARKYRMMEIIMLIQEGYVLIVYGTRDQIERFRAVVKWFYGYIIKPWELFSFVK